MSTAASVTMTGAEFHRLIGSVLPCAASDDDLPVLSAVHLETGPHGAYAVATNRYIFAAARHPSPSARRAHREATIPRTAAAAMLRLVRRSDPHVAVRISPAREAVLRTAAGITYRTTAPAAYHGFPNWRTQLTRLLACEPAEPGEPVHIDAAFLARFRAVRDDDAWPLQVTIRRRTPGEHVVIVSAGDWFLGAIASIHTPASAVTADPAAAWRADLGPAPARAA